MKVPASPLSGTSNGTDVIAITARRNQTRVDHQNKPADSSQKSSSFLREVPFSRDSEYVEADGKRYFLNAPRGTYLNILV